MALTKENRDAILERVILNHRSLQGMSQQLAEVYYIMEAQRLSGYGLECFAAKVTFLFFKIPFLFIYLIRGNICAPKQYY